MIMTNTESGILVLDRELVEEQRYWVERLSRELGASNLRADGARTERGADERASTTITLDEAVAARLRSLAGGGPFLTYTALVAALKVCLYKYAGESPIVVGSPALRGEDEAEADAPANLVAVLDELGPETTFRELLLGVRQTLLDAYERQRYPFRRVVRDLGLSAEDGRCPVFDIVVSFDGLHAATPRMGQDIEIVWRECGATLAADVTYKPELFRPETIRRFGQHLAAALARGVEDAGRRVRELDVCVEPERHQLLVEWNDTDAEFPGHLDLGRLFELHARRAPDAVAVVYADSELTYGELDARSERLAAHLRGLGVGRESRVGLCLERSLEMIVGILAVVKAGGAYVPLDPAYPQERLAWMMEDARLNVVLTSGTAAASLPDRGQTLVRLDAELPRDPAGGTRAAASASTSDQVVYVSYTSGSTGKPKGVEVTHKGIARLLFGVDYVRLGEQTRMLQVSPLTFDLATFEIWGALLHGGCCVLLPRRVPAPSDLEHVIRNQGVNTMWLTASLFNLVVDESPSSLAGVGQLLVGGEALSTRHVRVAAAHLPDTQLINGYGPTEATTFAACHLIEPSALDAAASVPIGRPIGNTQLYVLGGHGEPLPAGTNGELNIGGPGVARGYLNRPDLTAERFVPDPFGKEPGARLYRTGDLVRHLPDGLIEFLGRLDHQVKVRGFRIELGEIEAALSQYAGLQQAAVVVHEGESGKKRLVAYVVMEEGKAAGPGQLRGFLAERCPDYMIPTSFIVLDELPLTPSGKLNRRALPPPDARAQEPADGGVAPRTFEEEVLAEVWAEVLGLERVGVHDNYFELGGDSIRSIMVMVKAQERGVSFTIEQLFEHPTIERLAKVCEVEAQPKESPAAPDAFALISEEDRALLPADVEDAYPLTRLQAGMVFHSEYSPETPVYHEMFTFHIRARLDERVMRATVADLLARHPVLRTSFDLTGYGEPLQLVHREVEPPVTVTDLRHLAGPEQEAALADELEAEKRRPFDWSRAPLMRVKVFRRGEDTFQLMLSMHHSIMDGWSLATFLSELFRHYWRLLGEGAQEIEPPPQTLFRDYVALERRAVESAESRDFWHARLRDKVFTKLPRRSSRDAASAEDQKRQHILLVPEDVVEALNRFARVADAPVKSLLLAAHLRVLAMLGGQDDVLSGLAVHGRPETADSERVLGLFLNTVPFRMRLGGGAWRDLVREVFAAERELLPHRWYPMAELQHRLDGEQLFEVAFSLQHFHVYQTLEEYGDRMALLGGEGVTETSFTLMVAFDQDPFTARLQLSLTYDDQEMSAEQVRAVGGYYLNALSSMASDPSAPYLEQDLLTGAERERLLREWGAGPAPAATAPSVHALFARRAHEHPDAVALVCGDTSLTYAQLDRRSNQFARLLLAAGLEPDTAVGLSSARTPASVAALLGILKAGGAYLALDPSYPPARLALLVRESGARLVLADEASADSLGETGAEVIPLDAARAHNDAPLAAARTSVDAGARLAYVSFTSGSTGAPKGVAVTHASVVNLACQETFARLGPAERVLHAAPLSFDASTFELWGALLTGGCVVLHEGRVPEAATLRRAVEEGGVSVLWLTSSLFNAVADEDVRCLRGVEQLLVGGEALSAAHVGRALRELPRARLVNGYGPTETTTFACTHRISECDVAAGVSSIPIGQPIAGARGHVLDARMMIAPSGVAGELYVGGEGLARGYLNRPELTAERFVPDPFGEPGARLYRTGDLVRHLPDGLIEYLGRADGQVKVRGFRIELGEVESVLRAHPEVEEAVVVAREVEGGMPRQLAAYLVAAHGTSEATTAGLRAYLRERLPEYMVPSSFVALDSLPLNANGKVDRKALPDPAESAAGGAEVAAPRTATEELLAGIWEQVLKQGPIGIHTNFFDLGGHSLSATQVVSRVREVFEVDVPLRQLFETPTVAELAQTLDELRREDAGAPPSVEPRGADGGPVPLSFAQQRLWFMDGLGLSDTLHIVVEALRLTGPLQLGALEQAVNEIVRRHEVLRTQLRKVRGEPVQVVLPRLLIEVPVVDLSGASAAERVRLGRELGARAARRRMDLANGPLLRLTVMRAAPDEHVLLLVMHHVVTDAWSRGLFFGELARLYAAYSGGAPSTLAELVVQYADYAAWQRGWLRGEVLDEQLNFWKKRLARVPPALDLPTIEPRPAEPSYRSDSQQLILGDGRAERLHKLARREGVTTFMALLAVYQTVLYCYTGQDEVCVASPVANRHRAETEPLIGFFVNMIVLNADFGGDLTFRQLLRQVRETTLDAYAHQDFPFEKLVEIFQQERGGKNPSLAQAAFSFHGRPGGVGGLAGLRPEPFEVETETVEHDLTLVMEEGASGLGGALVYKRDLFAPATIGRMLEHLRLILDLVLEQPDVRILDLPLAGAAQSAGAPSGVAVGDEAEDFDFSF